MLHNLAVMDAFEDHSLSEGKAALLQNPWTARSAYA